MAERVAKVDLVDGVDLVDRSGRWVGGAHWKEVNWAVGSSVFQQRGSGRRVWLVEVFLLHEF
jgi:hypothetical protein